LYVKNLIPGIILKKVHRVIKPVFCKAWNTLTFSLDDDKHATGPYLHYPGDGALLCSQHPQVHGGDPGRQQGQHHRPLHLNGGVPHQVTPRERTEIVQHSAYRGSSHRRNVAACSIFAMIWLYLTGINLGGGGSFANPL
jgi:hypothetical protein